MAIGAYTMAILDRRDRASTSGSRCRSRSLITIAFGLLVGLPSLRLRADYFAIATIAAAEAVRLVAQNARDAHRRQPGLCSDSGFDDTWDSTSPSRSRAGIDRPRLDRLPTSLFPLLLVVWVVALILLTFALRADPDDALGPRPAGVREDEDAARALGKNAFAYKLQSLAIAAALGAIAGFFLALNLTFVVTRRVRAAGHLLRLRRPRPRRAGQLLGRRRRRDHPLDPARGPALPRAAVRRETEIAALRFIIVGLILIAADGVPAAGHVRQEGGDGPR